MKSLESEVPPSNGFSIIVGKSLTADFRLGLHYPVVEFLEGFGIKGFQKQGIYCGISLGYILGDNLQAFSSDGRHSACWGDFSPLLLLSGLTWNKES